ncbi:MAG: FAD-dependent oxidoreductase [Nocardioidaceae bacterium]|nr:FAD-dependent oxidoreductase [Nocardioidaceae bacterium]MCL2614120.1 FAD-dependent oxidoreductase [Nocardioidaceae bacterium]
MADNNPADAPHDIVIIGAGLAAAKAVETLRDEGYDGALTVVGGEPEPPYERPQLSKEFLKDEKDFELSHDADWYAQRDVRLLTGVLATELDLAGGSVGLDDGSSLPFGSVLLATGATPRRLDIPGAGTALTLRTIEDARRIKEALRPGKRVALVGGGWIGLEIAAAARERGAEAVVLEAADLPLGNVLGAEIARHLVDLHRKHGVDVRTGVEVTSIEPDGVVTGDGKVEADLVVMAVGAAPETALAEAAGLEVDGGVVVDQHLRTSDPRVLAAGDVAVAENRLFGPLRVEHWDNAMKQGELAARVMFGRTAEYDWAPYFFTDQFELSMEYVGHSAPDDDVVIRGDLEGDEFIAYWLRNGVVTAGMNVGIWDVNDDLRALVGTTVDPDALTDLR